MKIILPQAPCSQKLFRLFSSVLLLAALGLQAASVGVGGYTNDFSVQPAPVDFATATIAGGSGDVGSAATLDAAVALLTAAGINTPLPVSTGSPPAVVATAVFNDTDKNLQTRPGSAKMGVIMATLLNNAGGNASSVSINFNLLQSAIASEQVNGVRVYYSLTGLTNSWVNIPALSAAAAGLFSAEVSLATSWIKGSPLYVLFADDNGSPTQDTANQIDNFFIGVSAFTPELPVVITTQPQNLTVNEGQPASFTAAARANTPITLQWYRGASPITNATNASYALPVAQAPDSGALFSMVAANVASNVSYTATSSVATLTVLVDTNRPVLLNAQIFSSTQIQLNFSETITLATATNLANYTLTNTSGAIFAITSAALGGSQSNVVLGFSPALAGGYNYTVTVNGLRDQSFFANLIASNSTAGFLVIAYAAMDIGGSAPAGGASLVGDGYNVTGGGADIGGTSDQFLLNHQLRSGNFDIQVRVPAFSQSDALAKAGLMAREGLAANSRYAAVLATPSISGSFFQSRSAVGGATTSSGNIPVNYPYTWLRLQRVGSVFTGYISYEGLTWAQLGTVTLALTDPIYFGMAVSSHTTAQAATAQFRDLMDTGSALLGTLSLPNEPPGPSSRKTGLAITEIMYQPSARADGRELEFVEIFNSRPFYEDISGHRISGDVDYTFPPGTVLASGAYLVIAKVPADIQAVYGIGNVVGPYTNSLPNSSGMVRLRSRSDAVFLEVKYDSKPPWPAGADGTGHSLVLTRPSYGEGSPQAWSASDIKGGSPGVTDGVGPEPARSAVINEYLAHTDFPEVDYVELFNRGTQPLNLSGFWLSDDPATNKFRIPNGTIIPGRGFVSFTETTMGFSLSSGGEGIYLVNSNQTRVLDAVVFEGQASGVSSGRFPDGAPGFRELLTRTPGGTNTQPILRDIVVNEIMYDPISGNDEDQYVELFNRGSNAVSLAGWKFTAGISYTFPSNAVISARGYVVVGQSVPNLIAHYPGTLNTLNTFGGFGGSLAHGGERLALAKPDQLTNTASTVYSVVSEVTYDTGGRWGQWSQGGGSSLELIDTHSDPRLVPNWADSDETAKSAAWTTFEHTGVLDNGSVDHPASAVQVLLLGAGECLVDDVEVLVAGVNQVSNSTFESGVSGWLFEGTHDASGPENGAGYYSARSLHLRSSNHGGPVADRARTQLSSTLATGSTATLRAKVRWLRGHPEILLRLRGNWLEAVGSLAVPLNLGTPGAANSRAMVNAGPVIVEVNHAPVLPAASQAVIVTARVSDPDGVTSVVLKYRNDTGGGAIATLNMLDNGTGGDATAGDGIYSATIPGQSDGVMMAFYVQATDGFAPAATAKFPNDAPARECLVRFGETQPFGNLGTYRLWMTAATLQRWSTREKASNQPLDCTFVNGNQRVVYNMGAYYSGSAFKSPSYNSPTGAGCDYNLRFPDDDRFLGATDFEISTPGNNPGAAEPTAVGEQLSFWIARELGLPYMERRFIHFFVNGSRRSVIMEDAQSPNSDVIEEWFPDDTDGQLFKTSFSFEIDEATPGPLTWIPASLRIFNTTGGVKKTARYRWNWQPRVVHGSANDYAGLFALVDAANAPAAAYAESVKSLVDVEQWMRFFAYEHIVGQWDSVGYNTGSNVYPYKGRNRSWALIPWDVDISFVAAGPSDGLFAAVDPPLAQMNSHPPFRRAYWRALQDAVDGPLLDARVAAVANARYAALQANGLAVTAPDAAKSWISQRRTYILSQLATVAASFTVPITSITTVSNLATISGTAPIGVQTIQFNGVAWPVTWTGVTSWQARLPVIPGVNQFTVAGIDIRGNFVAGATNNVTVTYTGTLPSPLDKVVINEILFNPAVPGGEFIELFNNSATINYDLSGWQFNGLGYAFPAGSFIAPRAYLVLAKNRGAFATAYGATIPVFDEFSGNLQTDGETLTLIKPGATPALDVVIDKVRYEDAAPWSTNANGTGSSLQLLDPLQDNSRVGNWSSSYIPGSYTPGTNFPGGFFPGLTNFNLRFASITGAVASPPTLFIYLGEVGDVYIDDLFLANGTIAEAGANLIVNGSFETPLAGAPAATNLFTVGSYVANTVISPTNAHTGSNSLHIISTNTSGFVEKIIQKVLPVTNGQICTLSFWYRPTFSATNLYVRMANSSTLGSSSIPSAILTPAFTLDSNAPPAIIPPISVPGTPNRTPGAINALVATLPAFPPLWLNEVQAENVNGPTNSAGQHTPWLELYNAGTNTVTLTNLFLTGTYTNYTNWAFPAGATIGPGQFKVIFADGLTGLSTLAELHTSFALTPGSGSLALARLYNGQPQVIDYLNYTAGAGRSYGSFPDGQSFDRQEFYYVTPGATNNGTSPPLRVFINEWMAANTATVADPADNDFEDWFEIYNPGPGTADLSGYYLTDNLTNKFQYLIPAGNTIPPGGHLLVWADNETGQNSTNRSDLHASFKLAAGGEALGLFAADGTPIDAVTFGTNTANISQGRYPDGGPNIYSMTTPSPRAANAIPNVNTAPVLNPIGNRTVRLGQTVSFTATASDAEPWQTLTFSLAGRAPAGAFINAAGQFSWTPNPPKLPSTNMFTVVVTDNGPGALIDSEDFNVTVLPPPVAMIAGNGGTSVTLSFDTIPGRSYQLYHKANINDATWLPLGAPVPATGSNLAIADNIGADPQRFYRVLQVD